ncbi:hypothetical protein [Mobilicoccus caccae]|uniref:hypothetical protein n=1 Tax=Mobilicoccus caccae TaxID=1859295 RepID=UPI0024E0A3DB|nr:hypothetical protein [Mobilicoccus caccae]
MTDTPRALPAAIDALVEAGVRAGVDAQAARDEGVRVAAGSSAPRAPPRCTSGGAR